MTDSDGTPNRWDADAYESNHSFVYDYGRDVVDLLEPASGERILDLGCGTGRLTAEIAEAGADVVGVDGSREMVDDARTRYPDLAFVLGDAREFAFRRPFDAVFSNAMLHWVCDEDQDAVLTRVSDALEPEGRFVAELGGVENVRAIVDAVVAEMEDRGLEATNPWYFPSVGEYTTRLEAHGFEVRYARLFDRPTPLEEDGGIVAWLEMFGDSLFEPLSAAERRDVLSAVESRLRPKLHRDGRWVADYRRLRFVAVRTDVPLAARGDARR